MSSARELYLDLLTKCLTNLVYGPPPDDPWHDGLFRPGAKPGRDANSPVHTMVGILRLENVRALAQRVLDENIPGDFIETGVWRGGCCILMRGVLAANGDHSRRVYVADSFEGLPPPRPEIYAADDGDILHTISALAVSEAQVRDNFSRYGLLDGQVEFVKGFFSDTLPTIEAGPFALLRLDGDMYESTIVALEALYPKLSPGGFIIIDDYGAIAACRQAVEHYRSANGITSPLVEIDWTGVYWRKPSPSSGG
jgi:O-methyltransferase